MKEVTAAILEKDGKILIARRKADDRQAGKWEFPGGTLESDETPQECLQREMQEEFSIRVTVGQIVGESIYDYEHGTIKLIAYQASWDSGKMMLNEHAAFRWVSPVQLAQFDFAPADRSLVKKLQRQEKEGRPGN
ncbi:MAG: (deoxy)nucleoside triphosphate pyrophosphohydrolase [Desulfobacterales bacterium]|jgi:8-oxo-dGTP diphosphatase